MNKTLKLPKNILNKKYDLKHNVLYSDVFYKINHVKLKKKNGEIKILHDGPPFANGSLHSGHFYNRMLKNYIYRKYILSGHDVRYIMGWDCHGLPIENNIINKYYKDLSYKELDRSEIMIKSKSEAQNWIEIQKKDLKHLYSIVSQDFYYTMDENYENRIFNLLKDFIIGRINGHQYITERFMLMDYCMHDQCVIAEADIVKKNYKNKRIFFCFQTCLKDVKILIWTTTPWSIPANSGVAFNSNIRYVLVTYAYQKYLLEYDAAMYFFNDNSNVTDFTDFKNLYYFDFNDQKRYLFDCDFVKKFDENEMEGTGFVHLAPLYGEDDFTVHLKHDIEKIDLFVNGQYEIAKFKTKDVSLAEMYVIKHLIKKDLLFEYTIKEKEDSFSDRSKKRLIKIYTKQIFFDIQHCVQKALHGLKDVGFKPSKMKNKLRSYLEIRENWCISRQRYWGCPIPIISKNGRMVVDDYVKNIYDEIRTSKEWFDFKLRDGYKKENHVLDCWFESGLTQKIICKNETVDVIIEGSDQHRGWFQSLSIINGVLNQKMPKTIWTHGFVLDADGRKMSKSIGNFLTLDDIIRFRSIDVLNILFSLNRIGSDIILSDSIFKESEEYYRKIRMTLNFLLNYMNVDCLKNLDYLLDMKLKKDDVIDCSLIFMINRLMIFKREMDSLMNDDHLEKLIRKIYNYVEDLSSTFISQYRSFLYVDHVKVDVIKGCFTLILAMITRYVYVVMPETFSEIICKLKLKEDDLYHIFHYDYVELLNFIISFDLDVNILYEIDKIRIFSNKLLSKHINPDKINFEINLPLNVFSEQIYENLTKLMVKRFNAKINIRDDIDDFEMHLIYDYDICNKCKVLFKPIKGENLCEYCNDTKS